LTKNFLGIVFFEDAREFADPNDPKPIPTKRVTKDMELLRKELLKGFVDNFTFEECKEVNHKVLEFFFSVTRKRS